MVEGGVSQPVSPGAKGQMRLSVHPESGQSVLFNMNTRRILVAFAACSLMCGLASASTLEETFTGSATTGSTTDFAGLLTATQFNPAWGTLTGVEIDLTSNLSTVLTIKNQSSSGSSGAVFTAMQIFVQDPPANDLNGGTYSTGAGVISYDSPSFSYNLAGGVSTTSGILTASATQDVTYHLAAILAEYTGLGTFSLTDNTLTGTLIGNTGGNTTATQATTEFTVGDVIYTYTPPPSGAPEPATLFLMGSALVGVGVLRKRFKA